MRVGLRIACPNCGSRPYTEFWFDREARPHPVAGATHDEDFERVWLRGNVAGLQAERWFHYAGCRRWLTLERDTTTNEIDAVA